MTRFDDRAKRIRELRIAVMDEISATLEEARVVKILMRLPDGNISAAHLCVLYNRLIP